MWWFDSLGAPSWSDWLAIVLTIAGFVIAIAQIVKARNAATAAANALAKAEARLRADQLSAVLPQLSAVSADLDFAITENNSDVGHRALSRFAQIASETGGILGTMGAQHERLVDRLATATITALNTKQSLVTTTKPDVARTAKKTATEISSISGEIGAVVTTVRYTLGGEQ